jgi:class 3 adenylate cyclase/tetratricopeptide (TPR) repeat protein
MSTTTTARSNATLDLLASYLPRDRRNALATHTTLPNCDTGAVCMADLSGSTQLAEALARAMGVQRGAEEVTYFLNLVYAALTAAVDHYSGSVVNFAGDAITCWFAGDDGRRACAAALEMQAAMHTFASMPMPAGASPLTLHVGIAHGTAHRFAVGNPDIQIIDVLAGAPLERVAVAETLARSGEIVLDPATAAQLAGVAECGDVRIHAANSAHYQVLRRLHALPAPQSWPALPNESLREEVVRQWLLPPIHARLSEGKGEFLAELRPAVALFCNFSGIDFEDDPAAQDKLDAYVRWVQGVIAGFDGQLLQLTHGDKGSYFYAVFGTPVTHANDAERAAAAALALRRLPAELGFITAVQIGLSGGRVRAGPYGGSTRTYGALGDSVNLAARLMQAAQPGQILVSESLAPALDAGFVLQAHTRIALKGKREPIALFSLMSECNDSGIHLNEPRFLLPMLGREDEMAQINHLLHETAAGRGCVIDITAEAGMGKSRLVAEAIRSASALEFAGFGGASQAFGASAAYAIWQPIWRAFFGVDAAQSTDAQIAGLTQTLTALNPAFAARLPLLGLALGVKIPDNDFTRPLDARARKAMLEALLCEVARDRAKQSPLLFVLEDAHWIDSLSAELLEALSRVLGDAALVVLVTRRPASQSNGVLRAEALAHRREIELGDLSTDAARGLIRLKAQQIFGIDDAPADFVTRVAARAQGNPFYIEEIIGYLRDQHVQPDDAAAMDNVELPGSLASLILSHIDQLNEGERATIKVASIIGRRFLFSWLWGVYPELGEPAEVRADLDALDRLGLTPLDAPEPEPAYLFKHSLMQEVAYGSMTFAARCVFHEHLAGWLETTLPADALPVDLLAFHYGRTDNAAKELHYTSLAGEQATRIGAYAEAAAYLLRALDLVKSLAPANAAQQELSLQLNLGAVMINTRGQGSSDAKAAYDRARDLCQHMETTPQTARATFGLWAFYLFRGEVGTAHELAQECWRLAQEPRFAEFRLQTHLVMANTLFWLGRFADALQHFDQVVALYDPAQHHNYIVRYAQNPRITAATTAVVAYWVIGQNERSVMCGNEMYDIAQGLNHDFSVVLALHSLGVVDMSRGGHDALRERAGLLVERSVRRNITFYAALGRIQLGWLKVLGGDAGAGADEMRKNMQVITTSGNTLLYSFYVTYLAEALRRAGQNDEALAEIESAIAGALQNQRLCFIAEMYRMKGMLLFDQHRDAAQVELWLRKAIDTAQAQGAPAFVSRAEGDLAKVLQRRGDAPA